MALKMRALYYIALAAALDNARANETGTQDAETVRAVENCLNQNFTVTAQKLAELEERLENAENALNAL